MQKSTLFLQNRLWFYGFLLYGLGSIIFSAFNDFQHDYRIYTYAWYHIQEQGSVSIADGYAYGPLFYFFFLLFSIGGALPRTLFIVALISSMYALRLHISPRLYFIGVFLVSPLVLLYAQYYGSNDAFAAGLLVGFAYCVYKYRPLFAGLFLGLAISFKFTPILFIIPLITAFRNKRGLLIAGWAVIISIFILIWAALSIQYDILQPISFAESRPSKFLSVFRFLRGIHSPTGDLDSVSGYLTIVGYSIMLGWGYLKNWKWSWFIMTIYCWILLTSQVLHHQFFIPFYALALVIFAFEKTSDKWFWRWMFIHFIWINLTVVGYYFLDNYWGQWQWIRDWIGLPTFLLTTVLLILSIYTANKHNSSRPLLK